MATEAPAAPPPATDKPSLPAPAMAKDTQVTFQDGEAFGALESLAHEDGKDNSPVSKPAAPPEQPRRQDGTFDRKQPVDAKPEPKRTEPAKSVPADKGTGKPDVPTAPKQLREAYEAAQAKYAALEKEYGEYKKTTAQPKEDPEKKTLSERLTAREKRLAELEEHLRNTAYEKTDEFKQKFHEPFIDAYMAARRKTASLKLVERKDADTDQVIQQARQGTADDFDALMRITDDDQAADIAERWFGSRAPMVMYHRERVQELSAARQKAVDDAQKHSGEWEKTRREQQEAFDKNFTSLIETASAAAIDKFPRWFKPAEGDEKGNAILDKGNHLVARLVNDGKPLKEGEKQWGTEEMAKALSAVRTKAGAFDRVAYLYDQAMKRNANLQKELDEYKASEPGPGQGKRGGMVRHDQSEQGFDESIQGAQARLDALAR